MEKIVLLVLVVLITSETSGEFTCSSVGKFPVPNDLTCKRFHHCTQAPMGTYTKKTYTCVNCNFDPNTQACSLSYSCRTSPTPNLFGARPFAFTCTSSGLFPDLADVTCRRYYLCVKLFNIVYYKLAYNCPNSSFDPALGKCSSTYDCQRSYKEITIEPEETTLSSTTVTDDLEANYLKVENTYSSEALIGTQEKFDERNLLATTSTVEVITEENNFSSSFDDAPTIVYERDASTTNDQIETSPGESNLEKDTSSETLPTSPDESYTFAAPDSTPAPTYLEILSSTTEFSHAANEFECAKSGRFPDLEDETCSRYFLCSKLRNGTILKTAYYCPNSNFDPSVESCSTVYECKQKKTSPVYNLTTTSIPTSTVMILQEEFVCSAKGKFPDPNDETCQKYHQCFKLKNGSFKQSTYSCPSITAFDPFLKQCSQYYTCPNLEPATTSLVTTIFETTDVQMRTTENYSAEPIVYDFRCTEVGRYPDLNDRACKWYFLCNQLRNGTFLQTPYECPSVSIFDSRIQLCSTQILCKTSITHHSI